MMDNVVYVESQNNLFCINVQFIAKIIQLVELQRVPAGSQDLAGLLNYHGKLIPVFDLGLSMGFERVTSYTLNTIILICSNGSDEIGLIVDKVKSQGVVACELIDLSPHVVVNDEIYMIPDVEQMIKRQINS